MTYFNCAYLGAERLDGTSDLGLTSRVHGLNFVQIDSWEEDHNTMRGLCHFGISRLGNCPEGLFKT